MHFKRLLLLATCFLCVLAARGDSLPYFSALRSEVVTQLDVASNSLPESGKLAATLRSSLKIIDRTEATLTSGCAALGLLAKNLGRTTVSNAFFPIIDDLRGIYLADIDSGVSSLHSRLASTYPGRVRTAAERAVTKVTVASDNARTNASRTLAIRALGSAGKALELAEKAVGRAESADPGESFLTANITESTFAPFTFRARGLGVGATYHRPTGDLFFDGMYSWFSTDGRAELRVVRFHTDLSAEGTHTLSLTKDALAWFGHVMDADGEAIYVEYFFSINPYTRELGSGTLVLNVDLAAALIWGTYQFAASGDRDPERTATVNGSFLIAVEMSDSPPANR